MYGHPEKFFSDPPNVFGHPEKFFSDPPNVSEHPEKFFSDPPNVFGHPEKFFSCLSEYFKLSVYKSKIALQCWKTPPINKQGFFIRKRKSKPKKTFPYNIFQHAVGSLKTRLKNK